MIVLAIDTAGVDCSAALYDGKTGRTLATVTDMIGKGHAERLMSLIDEVLAHAGLELAAVDRIAVVIGPGSFTGIRVGVAAARGLALALDVDCVGITTLETLAATYLEASSRRSPVLVAMDAKRNELYVQGFGTDGRPLGDPAAMSPEDAAVLAKSMNADVTGSGRSVMLAEPQATGDRFEIAMIARLGAAKVGDASRPKPLYLRGPDAKPQTGYALARS